MLILSRKESESIMVGDNIALIVKKIDGNRVHIAIAAPKEVKILRGELVAKEQERSE